MPMTASGGAKAAPARFDRSAQHRRAMFAKIHVAKKQLAMDEDDYRQAMLDETGKMSLKDCNETDLERLIARFKRLGFSPLPKAGAKRPATHPMAKKARALWISLYQLGVVRNASEQALEAFAKRQLGCERLNWARQSDAYRLIEALKAMAERAGWRQRGDKGEQLSPWLLRQGLCTCILDRLRELGLAPDRWTLDEAAFRLFGIEIAPNSEAPLAEQYARLAASLGKALREAAPEAATGQDDAS